MVNETLDIATHILDFNLDTLSRQTQLQQSFSGNGLSPNSGLLQQLQIQLPDQQQQSSEVNSSTRDQLSGNLNTAAENLSWKFFEQISTLDNQLRSEEEPSGIQVNGSHLMSNSTNEIKTTPTATTKAKTFIEAEIINEQQQQETIKSKLNGIAILVASTTSDEILSQQSPDLIKPQLLLQQTSVPTFQFTSPTATFKRKKKQHQQQQQQLNHQNKSNNNNNNTINNQEPSDSLPSASINPATVHQTASHNVLPTIMFGSSTSAANNSIATPSTTTAALTGGSIIGIGIGSGARVPLKTHTLPSIKTATAAGATTPRQAYAADNVDLVGGGHTKATASGGVATTVTSEKRLATAPQKMGAKLTAALGRGSEANTVTGGTAISGNHSNSSGNSHSNSSNNNNHKQHCAFIDGLEAHFALIGWRKKCLYTLLLLLMVLIITNLVLTLWILKVMEFSTEGMGQLKIVPGGIQLNGQALVMDVLRASTIRSRHGQPISIESSRNFSINTRDANGMLENHLFLGHDKLECLSTGFRINDTTGRNLFSVNRNEVTIGAHALRIDGEGGAIFRESIQTPHVRAEPGRELRLESPTRQLELTAARDINLQSRAGGIELSALDDVRISAQDGSLRLESSKILMPNLRTAQPPALNAPQSREHLHRVFQLCACSNGKLFLAAPHSICAGDDSTVCR